MHRRRLLVLTVVLAVVAAAAPAARAASPDPAGRWEGTISVPGNPLKVVVKLDRKDESGWKGSISIPQQGAKDLPLTEIQCAGKSVHFTIAGVPGQPTFSGTLSEDGATLAGQFVQGGAAFPFSLARGEDAASEENSALAGFDDVVTKALQDFRAPGAGIAVVVDDQVVLAKGYGLRDIARHLPADEHTLFAIGSATKAFTTCLLGTLVDQGRLTWDTPVADLLPGFRLADDHATLHLTVRDLLTHRSGLPRHDLAWYNAGGTRAELVARLRYLAPYRDLREEWHYQNLMYVTAGYLAGQLLGSTWEDAVRSRILQPVGMSETNLSVLASQASPDHALPYREDHDKLEEVPFREVAVAGPAGAVNSTPADMARWLRLQLGDGSIDGRRVVTEVTMHAMHTPQMVIARYPDKAESLIPTYGLGWFITAYRGHYEVSHGGNIDGFSALVTLYPLDRVGIVVLVNKEQSPLPGLLSRTLADRLLGLEQRPWLAEALAKKTRDDAVDEEAEKKKQSVRVTGTKPAHPLADYAGEYANPGYGHLTVALADGQLHVTLHGIDTPLEHWHYEVFNGLKNADDPTFEDVKFTFRTSERGEVDAVTAPLEPEVADIVFTRLPDARLTNPAYVERFVGGYELAGETLTVSRQGATLILKVPNQPPYELEPRQGSEFVLARFPIISVRFTLDEAGAVTEMELVQPNGVFAAKRKESKSKE